MAGICSAGSCAWCGHEFRSPRAILYHYCRAMQLAQAPPRCLPPDELHEACDRRGGVCDCGGRPCAVAFLELWEARWQGREQQPPDEAWTDDDTGPMGF